jgi:16S rRNA processing protein RimM
LVGARISTSSIEAPRAASARDTMDPLEVGRIARPHGVRGWLKARLHWSESQALLEVSRVLVRTAQGEPRWFEIEDRARQDRGVLLKLSGIDDREAAESLRGACLFVERAQLGELEPGEFYLCDLIGAKVSVAGVEYGQVVDVRSHPTLDSIVVRTLEGILVEQPLTAPWLSRVDTQAGEVELASTDGVIA